MPKSRPSRGKTHKVGRDSTAEKGVTVVRGRPSKATQSAIDKTSRRFSEALKNLAER